MLIFPDITPGSHHFVHLLHLASLLHPLCHHFVHIIISKLFTAFKNISKQFRVRLDITFLFFLLFLLFFASCGLTSKSFLLPFVAHLSVDASKLSSFFFVLYELVIFKRIRTMVELEEEL